MSDHARIEIGELDRPTRLMRIGEVQYRTGLGRSTIYRWMAQGKFPRAVHLGGHLVAWYEAEIDAWIAARKI